MIGKRDVQDTNSVALFDSGKETSSRQLEDKHYTSTEVVHLLDKHAPGLKIMVEEAIAEMLASGGSPNGVSIGPVVKESPPMTEQVLSFPLPEVNMMKMGGITLMHFTQFQKNRW